jgi:chromosome condensin MukBEF ATPase and DNA-binding subunit MukB
MNDSADTVSIQMPLAVARDLLHKLEYQREASQMLYRYEVRSGMNPNVPAFEAEQRQFENWIAHVNDAIESREGA